MKKILLLITPLILFSSETLQNRVLTLEKKLKELTKEITLHQEDLDERMPIIEKVEKKAILDKLNFSPELMLRFDKMSYHTGKIDGENSKIYDKSIASLDGLQRRDEYSKEFDIATDIRIRLNMNANLDKNTKFNGRMVFTTSSQSNQRLCILSRDIKSAESSSAFDIDRAYIDYTLSKYSDYAFTFSFGLLPTTGGTPMQYAQNTSRKSMFPALVFDMNSYGMIATQKLGNNSYIRAIIAKAYTMRASFYPYQCNRENIDNANIFGLYSDIKLSLFKKSLLSFGVNLLNDFKAHPYLGPDISSKDAHNLGNIITFGLGLDIEEIAKTDLTFFLHSALSHPKGNSEVDDYQIIGDVSQGLTSSSKVGFSEASYAKGSMISSNGYALYLGTKYNFNSDINVGVEYNYGSKYWFSATQGAEDIYNKLATRGYVAEIYSGWNFHKNLYAKLGFIHIQENYTGSGWHFGEPATKDAQQTISYLDIEAKF